MFLRACRELAAEYPHIKYDEDLLDRVCLRIVQNPAPYADRVMVMPNVCHNPSFLIRNSRPKEIELKFDDYSCTEIFYPICALD